MLLLQNRKVTINISENIPRKRENKSKASHTFSLMSYTLHCLLVLSTHTAAVLFHPVKLSFLFQNGIQLSQVYEAEDFIEKIFSAK